jgi:hypothetical protein
MCRPGAILLSAWLHTINPLENGDTSLCRQEFFPDA